MYANLRVSIWKGDDTEPTEVVYAHEVVTVKGKAIIGIDLNDGTGNYAESGGERTIDLSTDAIRIEADF